MIRLLALLRGADNLPTIQNHLDREIAALEGRGDRLRALMSAPWQDEFGFVHCAACGGATRPVPARWFGVACRC